MSNPLDEELFDEELESDEDSLARYMASLGFRPKNALTEDSLEYYKMYSDASGRIGRTVVVVKKDEVGITPKEVDYVTVTVQLHIPAVDHEIKARAPAFCRDDVLKVVSHFEEKRTRREASTFQCTLCGVTTSDFVLMLGQKVCHDCGKRKGIL